MIKAIAFDLWETLITDTPVISRAQEQLRLQRMERILGQRATAERIAHAHRQLWHRCHELYWSEDKDIPCRTQIDHFLEELEVSVDDATAAALEEAYATAAVEVLPSIVNGADIIVSELKRRGYRLGLISNTGRTPGYALRAILDRLGFPPFDAMVFSNEHGQCKPHRSIFEALRQSLDVPFDETLFIGDNLYVDVHGAQRCGMRAVHFVPPVRGTAVAPAIDHDLKIEPDATIRDLRELLPIIELAPARTHTS
jgi:putative hydrolase of the HAD superfamily